MAHGYRNLQQWDQWLAQQFLGKSLLEAEQTLLSRLLNNHFGKHALLIGVPHQCDLLKSTPIPYHSLISPLIKREHSSHYIEGEFHELPILTGSIDLVLLPHTLEFMDNPRQLLTEACRITKPEGLIVICGFNPYSSWGLKKFITKHKAAPWNGHFIHSHQVKSWLQLADFKIEQQKSVLYRPPVMHKKIYQKLHFLERLGNCFSRFGGTFGGAYILFARAKVIPLTPIKMKWKQKLSGIRISPMPGHVARQLKNHS